VGHPDDVLAGAGRGTTVLHADDYDRLACTWDLHKPQFSGEDGPRTEPYVPS
jgi:hypothetical protein